MTQPPDRQIIKETAVGHGHIVVTTWLSNRFCLMPFAVRVRDETGSLFKIGDYTCADTALHAHDATARRLTELSAGAGANAELAR